MEGAENFIWVASVAPSSASSKLPQLRNHQHHRSYSRPHPSSAVCRLAQCAIKGSLVCLATLTNTFYCPSVVQLHRAPARAHTATMFYPRIPSHGPLKACLDAANNEDLLDRLDMKSAVCGLPCPGSIGASSSNSFFKHFQCSRFSLAFSIECPAVKQEYDEHCGLKSATGA